MRRVIAKIYKNKEWIEVQGLFHQWAAEMEESREGFGNYTVAIIELPDGQVETALPENVRFLDEEK